MVNIWFITLKVQFSNVKIGQILVLRLKFGINKVKNCQKFSFNVNILVF